MEEVIDTFVQAMVDQDIRVVKTILEGGFDPNTLRGDGFAPINLAASLGNVAAVELLLEAGADPNTVDPHDQTPLQYSAYDGTLPVATSLIKHGATVNIKTQTGLTALAYAVQESHEEMVSLLAQNGADLDFINQNGITPLFNSSGFGNLEMVRLLLDLGARVNTTGRMGTALHNACAYGRYEVAEELIQRGVDLEAVNDRKQTALFSAVIQQELDLIALLVEKGASTQARDAKNRTPKDYALKIRSVKTRNKVLALLAG